ncbi:type I-C CRISPR-associated protein Cas8c/Csd1 [Salinactinospora qingdaonensis]|uniref:Type I-C CRISPR-associated protein Cas8c/Csd1 n=1 Tax=Salinactinospora qingdaonensis TaxID=702744 RepID=A0ABP7FV16_9ACTN
MLLNALAEHARRNSQDLPPPYHRRRSVRWMISLTSQGHVATPRVPIHDLAGAENPRGQLRATPFVMRTSGIAPALVVDTAEYVLGTAKEDTDKSSAAAGQRHAAYRALLRDWRDAHPEEPMAQAVVSFFDHERHRELDNDQIQASDLVALQVDDQWVHEAPAAAAYWVEVVTRRKSPDARTALCLVCGQEALLVQTMPEAVPSSLIPVAEGRGNEVQIVSINKPAQGRGGEIQLDNTPICGQCAGQATNALTALLSDERHRERAADSVMTWWSREPAEDADVWDVVVQASPQAVKNLRRSVEEPSKRPNRHSDVDADFYALTVSANRSRLVVRDWLETTLPQLRHHLVSWCDDHEVFDPWAGTSGQRRTIALWRLALALSRYDGETKRYISKTEPRHAKPRLLQAALAATSPPQQYLSRLLQRISAEHHVDPARMALIRLLLTRSLRPGEESVMPELDPDSIHPAYLWGRAFAVCASIQREALGDVNAGIEDRFFRVAMTRPRSVYPALIDKSKKHLRKLQRDRKTGAAKALEERLAEVLDQVGPTPLPAAMATPEQGRFIAGFYHQRAEDIRNSRARKAAKNEGGTNDDPPNNGNDDDDPSEGPTR